MRNSLKYIVLGLLLSARLFGNDGLGHQTVKQNYPLPAGWVPNPRVTFNNSEPPIIFVEQGDTTTVTFPKEISKCKESSSIFEVVESKGDTSVYEIDIITNKDGIEELRESMAATGRTVYDSSFVNLNCRFKNGKLAILRLKLYPYPYYSVELIIPKQRRDYSGFYKESSAPRIETVPYQQPKRRKKDEVIVSNERDFSLFEEVLGEAK